MNLLFLNFDSKTVPHEIFKFTLILVFVMNIINCNDNIQASVTIHFPKVVFYSQHDADVQPSLISPISI